MFFFWSNKYSLFVPKARESGLTRELLLFAVWAVWSLLAQGCLYTLVGQSDATEWWLILQGVSQLLPVPCPHKTPSTSANRFPESRRPQERKRMISSTLPLILEKQLQVHSVLTLDRIISQAPCHCFLVVFFFLHSVKILKLKFWFSSCVTLLFTELYLTS